MTTNDAARLAHCTRQNISRHCKRGTIKAIRRGRDWWIEPKDLQDWLDTPPDLGGRPKKPEVI